MSPTICFGWRRLLLRAFGAELGRGSHVYPSTRIWAPWNLRMAEHACLGPEVDCYNVAPVTVQRYATVSKRTFLCTAGHDIHDPERPLTMAPITIMPEAYVFAEAFIGQGVTIGERAVVAARAVVVRDVAPGTVVAGNPAKVVGNRLNEPSPRPDASVS